MLSLLEGGGDWWLVMVRRSVLPVVLPLVLVLVAAACSSDRGGASVWVSPSEVTLAPGESQEFTAGVQGARDALVEWSASGGDLVASGVTAVFTAPAEVGEYTVTARSARDRGRWASATVTVELDQHREESNPPPYTGEAPVTGEADDDGAVAVLSETLGVRYELQIRREGGGSVAGARVSYWENARGRSEFVVMDPEGRFPPVLLVGTPDEIAESLGASGRLDAGSVERLVEPITVIAGVVFLGAAVYKLWHNGVAYQEVETQVETGADLCDEPDVFCKCASLSDIAALQRAAARLEKTPGSMVTSLVLFAIGLGPVPLLVEVAGIGIDLASVGADHYSWGRQSDLLVDAASRESGLVGIDADELLLVRLLGFESGVAGEVLPTWRAVQVMNRGCDASSVVDGGRLEVSYSPSPSAVHVAAEDVVYTATVSGAAEAGSVAGLDVFFGIRNDRRSWHSAPYFERWMHAVTDASGQVAFRVPPHGGTSAYEVVVPERGLAVRGTVGPWLWERQSGRPSPSIYGFASYPSQLAADELVSFRYTFFQEHVDAAVRGSVSCRLDLGDGLVRSDVSCRPLPDWNSFQHTYVREGDYVATLTLTNAEGGTDVVQVPVSVLPPTNASPVVDEFVVSPDVVGVDELVSVRFAASDTDDDDGDRLSCRLDFGDGSRARVVEPCGTPETVEHRYRAASVGQTFAVTLSVTDGRGGYSPTEVRWVEVQDTSGPPASYELTVTPGGIAGSAPAGSSFVGSFELENSGDGALVVSSIEADASWVSVSPSSVASLAPGDSVAVSVTLSAVGLTPGLHEAVVTASWSSADGEVSGDGLVLVEFEVESTGGDFEPAPSYISISNVSLGAASGGTRRVGFDISWDESWRGPDRPTWVEASDNWDAAWVFVKYRVDGGAWQHATLAGSGHAVPSGAVVDVPSDRVGAFIYRSSSGYGTFTANGVGLRWDYVADGVAAGASVEVVPFGIEMVYVPEGSFHLGSGATSLTLFPPVGEFRAGETTNTPFVVLSQSAIALGDGSGQLMWTTDGFSGSPSGTTSASFPTGYGAFYVMKYQVTQGQYVDFLNTLSQAQADARKHSGSSYRYAITGDSVGSYATSLPFVALNYVSWADGAAFADWAGLRPLTELEFEKAARGPVAPVVNEFAWGSRSITQATGLANAGTITETPTPASANAVYGNAPGVQGPVRVGSLAAPGRSRRDAGAGYYGALELSGNLWERTVTVGNAGGRAFTGTHGDGTLDGSGNANVVSWPGADAVGAGFRGGSWGYIDELRVSDRHYVALTLASRSHVLAGWRGARSAP